MSTGSGSLKVAILATFEDAESLGVIQKATSLCPKAMGIVQKKENGYHTMHCKWR